MQYNNNNKKIGCLFHMSILPYSAQQINPKHK